MVISAITGSIGTKVMIASYQAGTLVFKDLVFPQWWLDWIIPLSSLVMLLQALEMLVNLIRTPASKVPAPVEGVPGVPTGRPCRELGRHPRDYVHRKGAAACSQPLPVAFVFFITTSAAPI